MLPVRKRILNQLQKGFKWMEDNMVGPIEKGIQAARLQVPPSGVYENIDLRTLPKYISYRAAALRERTSDKFIILILAALLIAHYTTTRFEIADYQKRLRYKDFVAVPGVQDFTTVSPHMIDDSYVQRAVSEFISNLGNVNAKSVNENYQYLADTMTAELGLKFQMEARDWIEKIKQENITEVFTVSEKEIISDGKGRYKVTALGRRDIYVDYEHVNFIDEVIEMELTLVSPKQGRRWQLQITQLKRSQAGAFKSGKSYLKPAPAKAE